MLTGGEMQGFCRRSCMLRRSRGRVRWHPCRRGSRFSTGWKRILRRPFRRAASANRRIRFAGSAMSTVSNGDSPCRLADKRLTSRLMGTPKKPPETEEGFRQWRAVSRNAVQITTTEVPSTPHLGTQLPVERSNSGCRGDGSLGGCGRGSWSSRIHAVGCHLHRRALAGRAARYPKTKRMALS